MNKRALTTIIITGIILVFGAVISWWKPWVPYLDDEEILHPDGILETVDGKTYGYSEGCDVYQPEHISTNAKYEDGNSLWENGKIIIDGKEFGVDCTVKDFLDIGYVEDEESSEDDTITLRKDNTVLHLSVNDYGNIYKVSTDTPGVNFLKNSKAIKRRSIKSELGEPCRYSRFSKDSIGYTYFDIYPQYELNYVFSEEDGKLHEASYLWYFVMTETDNDNDGTPERDYIPTEEESIADYYSDRPYVDEKPEEFEKRTGIKYEDYLKRIEEENKVLEEN